MALILYNAYTTGIRIRHEGCRAQAAGRLCVAAAVMTLRINKDSIDHQAFQLMMRCMCAVRILSSQDITASSRILVVYGSKLVLLMQLTAS